MIVALHVATGAAAGALAGTRARALAVGPLLHLTGDAIPHQDFSLRFELASGAAALAALAFARGPLDPTVMGAAAASAPDLEHVIRVPRPGGRKLFPSHRFPGWHRSGGVSAPAQLLVSAVLLALLIARR